MRTSGRSNVVTWLTSKAFGVRSLAPAKPAAFPFCAVRLAMFFTEDSEGNEGWSWVLQPLRYLRFLLWIFFSSPLKNFYRRQRSKQRFELGLQHFVIFASFCLLFSAALLRIGWEIEREFRGSDRILFRPGWSDVVF